MTSSVHSSKVAIVTGASSGIGAAVAARLAGAGYRVFNFSRRAAAGSIGVTSLAVDVRNEKAVQEAVSRVVADAGRIDLLVNNAGRTVVAAAEETSLEEARDVFDVNFFGLVSVTTAVLPTMRKQRSGRIVNISSVLGFLPVPYAAAYVASKHAVGGYTTALDHEVRNLGVRAILVEPGFIRTDIVAHIGPPARSIDDYAATRSRVVDIHKGGTAGGESPEVVADAVLAAATDARPQLRYAAGAAAAAFSKTLPDAATAAALDRQTRDLFQMDI